MVFQRRTRATVQVFAPGGGFVPTGVTFDAEALLGSLSDSQVRDVITARWDFAEMEMADVRAMLLEMEPGSRAYGQALSWGPGHRVHGSFRGTCGLDWALAHRYGLVVARVVALICIGAIGGSMEDQRRDLRGYLIRGSEKMGWRTRRAVASAHADACRVVEVWRQVGGRTSVEEQRSLASWACTGPGVDVMDLGRAARCSMAGMSPAETVEVEALRAAALRRADAPAVAQVDASMAAMIALRS